MESPVDLSQVSFVIILQLRFQLLFTKDTVFFKHSSLYVCSLVYFVDRNWNLNCKTITDVRKILTESFFMLFSSNWEVLKPETLLYLFLNCKTFTDVRQIIIEEIYQQPKCPYPYCSLALEFHLGVFFSLWVSLTEKQILLFCYH